MRKRHLKETLAFIKNKKYYYYNTCICGNKFIYRGDYSKKSCGCLFKVSLGESNESSEYRSWRLMKERCYRIKKDSYPLYGGRGIKVCDRWLHSYVTFLRDMGRKPKGYTLDRINPFGNYEPSNCRWATSKQQANNKRCHYSAH